MANNTSANHAGEFGQATNSIAEVTRKSELQYLAQMLPEMRSMALSLEERTLAYLLELASMEARMQLQILDQQAGVVDGKRMRQA